MAALWLAAFAMSGVFDTAHAASACPSAADSAFRRQVKFAWEGSSASYSGSGSIEEAKVLMPIGEHTARIPEASDAGASAALKVDGADGDVDFQFGNLKPIATVGEVDYKTGTMIVGVPDGLGAYLADDDTVRCVVQSESYGPISAQEVHPYLVNDGAAAITGSHVQYVDYDRSMMAKFMTSNLPASLMVKGAGELIQKMYNLRGELVGARNKNGATIKGAMDSNVDKDGNYVLVSLPKAGGVAQREADWTMQSLCSAQLAEKHQWGEGKGFEDDIFLTNEEWITLDAAKNKMHIGLPGHAVDAATKTAWAVGAFTLGGFEKVVEFNSGSDDYVVLAVSGYNGAFDNSDAILAAKRASGKRPDGTDWEWPQNIVPARIYIGKKGKDASGAAATDFLSRNGLAYGQMYGFAVDSSSTDFADRDAWHKTHYNGDSITGKFYPIDWRWNGVVENFDKDGSWNFQIPPKNGASKYVFWNGKGNSESGSKTEHVSPDPTGAAAFYQTSTAGYFGKYEVKNLAAALTAAASNTDPFPAELDAVYSLFQGETDITDLIDLGKDNKGQCANTMDQTTMCDSSIATSTSCDTTAAPGKVTFEDIDGFEAIEAADGTFSIIQEDGGNNFGERMFVYRNSLSYGQSPANKPFKFIAQSGGKKNSRMLASVGVPAGSNTDVNSHEFSGVDDLSGFFVKSNNAFVLKAADAGYKRRELARTVTMNDKLILIGLQSHNLNSGVISRFNADRGGQWLLFQPRLEGDGVRPQETTSSPAQYKCNPYTEGDCHIHPTLKSELDAACGTSKSPSSENPVDSSTSKNPSSVDSSSAACFSVLMSSVVCLLFL